MKRPRLIVPALAVAYSLVAGPSFAQSASAPTPPPTPAPAPEPGSPASTGAPDTASGSYPSDDDRLDGDHLKLRVNVWGFQAIDGPDKGKERCALKGTKIIVTRQKDDHLLVRIELDRDVKQAKAAGPADTTQLLDKNRILGTNESASSAAFTDCGGINLVNDYTEYTIGVEKLTDHAFRRTGVMFGALIVPFKFHMGGANKLSPSSTVAPYIGFRGPAPFGLTFTPIVSAGLGLVPVAKPDSDETETKSAFSFAIGLLLTQSKNDKFNAGLLVGKDFLSKGDRGSDDTVSKIWFSLYAGYKL